MSIESDIKQKALEVGFDAVGITTAEPIDPAQADYFRRWLEGGNAGKMGYLYRNIEKRFAPAKLLPGAKSVICVALNYRPENKMRARRPRSQVARFAQYEDYHPFIRKRLFELAEFTGNATVSVAHNNCGRDARVPRFKVCVDSTPLAERALAQRAGLGFIGKNRMLIHPELGCQILLGELITTLELKADMPLDNQACGDCGKCIRACPTGALSPDGSFDARKCISYWTIETGSADVPPAMEHGLPARAPSYIFGCDECMLACPHETDAPPRKNNDFQHHPEWQDLTPDKIQNMTQEEFEKIFSNSGFLRLGLERLKRNC